ncbi:putative HMG box transcriptional regulator [Aspergillus saccharolyticus JOP 1030-1]|uniref:HMG box protein n=1 Tax=Aspergillus saccharolyticus JOP 1030-1 TaxID=1450539 RepID=A0A318ZFY3_9EURO|nr:HMG box protein [Aspergillus saccharolyticus JOP 1030-1]PYH45254.1 HMG box protein [Aspergillus saccharolyticus JOP 1030-1]
MSFDRVLPMPPALQYDPPPVTLPRPTGSLLDHKIMNDGYSKMPVMDHHHRDATSFGGHRRYADNLPHAHMAFNRYKMAMNKAVAGVASLEPAKPTTLMGTKPIPLRERSSMSERSSSSSPVKSVAPTPRESAANFCLCQPDPKIPRPRNAFILYRQHWQASVVAQHPGLANPEISKIIGEQWRKLPQETKDTWKALAEEEKARHQQQYPEYRYQPRRYGRDGSSRNASSGISHNPPGSTVCSRCGGRVMNPPVSPDAPPFTPSTSGFNEVSPRIETVTVRSSQGRSKDMDRPASVVRIAPTAESQSPHQRHFEESGSRSPDNKRRRFNTQVPLQSNIPRDRSPDSTYPISPYTPHSTVSDTRGFLQLAPPQRPIRNAKDFAQPDPSLKLPPLQTTTSPSQSGVMTPMTPFAREESTLEATVMTIPFLNKIKVLAKISPPLAPPYHGNTMPPRGAVIAVDGQDLALVKTMVDHLNNTLQKEGRYQTYTFTGPDINPRKSYSDSEQMGDATVDYLNIISEWHRISDKIINFVKPPRASSEAKSTEEEHTGVSPRTTSPKTADMQISSPKPSGGDASPSAASTEANTNTHRVPVALVPRYQLTTADAFACSVQISDSYAPLDHWQWMASLWRACVGPDITVYIRECDKEELDRYGSNPVEIRLQDARTVVVRRAASSSREMEEKIMKRVSFEIEDFLTQ